MGGNAMLAGAQNGMNSVHSLNGGATAARVSLIAGAVNVIEVITACSLHDVAADRRHVAQLRRSARQEGPGKNRVLLAYQLVVGDICVRCQRSYQKPTAWQLLDCAQI